MAACKRSMSVDEDPERDDEEGDEDGVGLEFEKIKKWLDEQTPSTSTSAPSTKAVEVLENQVRCNRCGWSPCK